jgi:hypothetical protein
MNARLSQAVPQVILNDARLLTKPYEFFAHRGERRAAQELLRRGRKVLLTPDDSQYMSAEDFKNLLAGLGDK